MSFPDLRTFIDRLTRDRDIVTIDAPVDPVLEAAEIHRRVIAANGPALIFRHVKGADFPLVTNLFGTPRRAELAFGERPLRLIKRLVQLVETIMPPTPGKIWGARDLGLELLKVGVKRGSGGPVTDVVTTDVRLDRLPAMTTWPDDGGPFVTLPLVYTQHPDGRGPNLGMYRLHVHDARTTGMHWQIGKGGGFHYQIAESRNQALPVTVFLGGPPALILSAIAPLPENVPEMMLASLIAGERIRVAEGPWPHPLVASAEFALIGDVAPHVRKPEGPFGDHYGYYSLQHDYPVFNVTRIARRRDAMLPATVVDRYADDSGTYFAVQALSQAADRRLPLLTDLLVEFFAPRGILARNDPKVRHLEGLPQSIEVLHGDVPDRGDQGLEPARGRASIRRLRAVGVGSFDSRVEGVHAPVTKRPIIDRNPRGFAIVAGVGVALVGLPLVGLLARVDWSRFVSLLEIGRAHV